MCSEKQASLASGNIIAEKKKQAVRVRFWPLLPPPIYNLIIRGEKGMFHAMHTRWDEKHASTKLLATTAAAQSNGLKFKLSSIWYTLPAATLNMYLVLHDEI